MNECFVDNSLWFFLGFTIGILFMVFHENKKKILRKRHDKRQARK